MLCFCRTHGYFDEGYFGGVVAFTRDQFWEVNGFALNYYNWGKEDDDLFQR